MTANDNKSYLSYLNKLVDKYNNTYNHSIGKKSINAGYSAFSQKLGQILNWLNLKLVIHWELLNTRIYLVKVKLKIGQKKYLLLILC